MEDYRRIKSRRVIELACRVCIGVLICLFAGQASAQTVALRYKGTPGTELKYKLIMDTPGLQASQKIEIELARKFETTTNTDNIKISTSFNNASKTINGISYPFGIQGQVLSATQTTRGEAISTTATGELGSLFQQAGLGTSSTTPDIFRSLGILEFPEAAVAAGSTWSVKKNHTFANGDVLDISYDYTLERFAAQGGYNCAKILVSAQIPISVYDEDDTLLRGMQMDGMMNLSGTLWFAHAEGLIVQLAETIESHAIGTVVEYHGKVDVIPVYQKTTVSVLLLK